MSFRKRSEIVKTVPGGATGNDNDSSSQSARPRQPPLQRSSFRPAVPGRATGPSSSAHPVNPLTANRFTPQIRPRGPVSVPGRNPVPSSINNPRINSPAAQSPNSASSQSSQLLNSHPGIKPSIITSQPCTSTGSNDLDLILAHQGLPVGHSLLIEETGTTDFSSTLAKLFLAQGVVHNRIDPAHLNTHEILVGFDQTWVKSLPGVYKGSSRERKKLAVKERESKVSVSNILDQQNQRTPEQEKSQAQNPQQSNMKIAWRYGLQKQQKKGADNDTGVSSQYPHYNNQFDITSTLLPAAGSYDLTPVPLAPSSFKQTIQQIESIIKRYKDRLIRIVIPLFLNPVIYGDYSSSEILQFVYKLRSLLSNN
ncbi:unnamed protein product [Ambrosiozyma monospora]|uniref:Elongator complex protein 4 n=1 Tax=Ambrosiozyma monospora TaxID=43982 RepID=A0A9W6Z306_AMBMO|nr:unnamed protein product [Ambrosiozyma monospora]